MQRRLLHIFALSSFALFLALLLQGPNILHQRDPAFSGVYVPLNSDEPIYLARVQESLSGRPEQSAEAFTGHQNLVGSQFGLLERWYGDVYRFTGWRAGQVFVFHDVLIPVLIFALLVLFFRLSTFSFGVSFFLSSAFCLIELYNLSRPIHMRSSFLLMLLTFVFILAAVRSRWWWAIPAGAFLGLLIGVYVWSFMFAWAFFGIYLLWECIERSSARKPLLICAGVGILAALPFVWQYIALSHHPLYEYASYRSGMHPERAPESWIYSGLFLVMVCSLFYGLRTRYTELKPYRPAIILVFAAFVYMNQQVVHGITFNFVSHGIFSLVLAALAMIAVAAITRHRVLFVGALAACVYLAAVFYDGRYVLGQWTQVEKRMSNQHLSTMLPVLDALPRKRILSDSDTSSFLAGNTHHDIVYSVYLKNVLMTHRELASRLCLTLLPLEPEDRHVENYGHRVYPDAISAFGGDTRQQEDVLVDNACRELDLDPSLGLEMFEVSHVLWNRQEMPYWNLSRLGVNLEEIAAEDTWVLYRIR